jgi:hypothetical protein
LGFLGFPPFAVECLVVVRFGEALWQRVEGRGVALRRGLAPALAALGSALTALAFALTEPVTIDSYHVPVAELEALPEATRRRLSELGLRAPERLVAALSTTAGRAEWSRKAGLGERELEEARDHAALVLHRGLGQRRALQLRQLGIRDVEDLRRWSPSELSATLGRKAEARGDPFLERRARVWLQGLR